MPADDIVTRLRESNWHGHYLVRDAIAAIESLRAEVRVLRDELRLAGEEARRG